MFQAAGASVCLLPLIEKVGVPGWTVDPVLVCALGALALTAYGVRAWLRRSRRDQFGGPMALALLLLGAPLIVAIFQTGGFASPLIALLGALVGAAATILSPVWNFFHTAAALLLLTATAVAAREGWLPSPSASAPMGQLIGVYGFLVVISFLVQTLAGRVRDLSVELLCRDVRDPETGLFTRSLFHTRLVGLLDAHRQDENGVGVIVLDCTGHEKQLARAGAAIADSLRADDLVGRDEGAKIMVALPCASETFLPRIAQRLLKTLNGIDIDAVHLGMSFVDGIEVARDTVTTAQELVEEAAESLHEARRVA